MKISFNKIPLDIALCLIVSIFLFISVILDEIGFFRIFLGILFILFIPGYIFILALYPGKKTGIGIDVLERIALSFGFSIVIVPIIAFGLNFTSIGIQLDSILFFNFIFVMGTGSIAAYRWYNTSIEKRFIISLNLELPRLDKNKFNRVLTLILFVVIIVTVISLFFVAMTYDKKETYTILYLLDKNGVINKYSQNLTIGETSNVTIGLVNHEFNTINYTIEIWLLNRTILINHSTMQNYTHYNNMWFMDKIEITLNHYPINIEEKWNSQWERIYTYNINKKGNFILAFLLYDKPTEKYLNTVDYVNISEKKINNAYRVNYLVVNVN